MAKNYFMDGPSPPGSPEGMLIVGHSWAYGAFDGREGEVGDALGVKVVSSTKERTNIDYAKGEIKNLPGSYKCALLFTGINDNLNDTEGAKAKFDALIREALKTSSRVYVVNIPYYDPQPDGVHGYDRAKIDKINRYLENYGDSRVVCIKLNQELIASFDKDGKDNGYKYRPSVLHPGNYNKIREFLVGEISRKEKPVTASNKLAH